MIRLVKKELTLPIGDASTWRIPKEHRAALEAEADVLLAYKEVDLAVQLNVGSRLNIYDLVHADWEVKEVMTLLDGSKATVQYDLGACEDDEQPVLDSQLLSYLVHYDWRLASGKSFMFVLIQAGLGLPEEAAPP